MLGEAVAASAPGDGTTASSALPARPPFTWAAPARESATVAADTCRLDAWGRGLRGRTWPVRRCQPPPRFFLPSGRGPLPQAGWTVSGPHTGVLEGPASPSPQLNARETRQ